MSAPTLLRPHGYSSSTCGYCTPSGSRSQGPTSKKYGLEAPQMSVQFYQDMIDRGWRRSGDYVYHPDMARTCCPQYTIRLDAHAFKPDKKQRQVMNRFNRFLTTGLKPGEAEDETRSGNGIGHGKGKGKAKAKGGVHEWAEELRAYQVGYGGQESKHRFETVLVPAKATAETFELYKKYQIAVHQDPPAKISLRGFSRFLCESPLADRPIRYSTSPPAHLPSHYGSFHLLYKLDGEVIGISVIDILPLCVSSVYFIWDPEYAWASLGKLSALHEISLVRDMAAAGAEGMQWLYMGYWISNCVKMRYKSEYSPSYVLDPGTHEFHLLTSTLDKSLQSRPTGYHPFAQLTSETNPADSTAEVGTAEKKELGTAHDDEEQEDDDEDMEEMDAFPSPPPPGFLDPQSFTQAYLDTILVSLGGKGRLSQTRVYPLGSLEFGNPTAVDQLVRELVAAVGQELVASADDISGMADIADKGSLLFGR